ncbi:MAG TPA: Rne/Rng family ribonuclease [Acidobacteriaceae bacterium]|nr:Rne/Rng family ribonuclease [Acidobacteriaceae bacterium]
MAKEICISSTPHETRLAILEDDQLAEIYYERENEYTLAGSIYKGKVTRVLPGMQSAFVDVGLERDAFLYVTDFLEEQEESEEYERVDSGSGNGRERRPGREGGERRESRDAREPRESREPRGRAQEPEADLSAAGETPLQRSDRPQESQEGDESGVRRWRGRRGRGFRGRGGRDERGGNRSGERGDRGDARSEQRSQTHRALESPEIVEEAISAEPVSRPERGAPGGIPAQNPAIVLPGESLSKYGGRPAESRSANGPSGRGSAPVSRGTAKPSTQVDVPMGWDGGATLPGETLSRHRRGAEPVTLQQNQAAAVETPAAQATLPVVETPQVLAPASEYDVPAQELGLPTVAEPPAAAVLDETVEEEQEYEPEEASASHRVETPRSEFRFSAPTEETEEVEMEEEEQTAHSAAPPLSEAQESAEVSAAEEAAPHEPSPESEVVQQLFGYAPGVGVLEEETIDEDEYDFEPIPGEHDEHLSDEMEEETLNQAATIEDAVRDEHVEKRLAYSSPTEAGEDEETDDLQTGFAEGEESEFDGEDGAEEETEEGAEETAEEPAATSGAPARREDRRLGRRGGRGRQQPGGGRRHGRRPNMQTSDLPIISELLKPGQEILVQIAKEPIARKGARITSHIALPGRFLVFMPTVNHVGVSRKIESDEERQRLKRILVSEKGTASGGFIVRTAAESASEDDLRADLRFLINLWNEIKQRSDTAKAPALIYHDLNLIERILRDQVSDNFSTIWVDSESEYERILRFLNRFQPSLVRRVKLYTKEMPLFEQFGIQEEISKALKSKVWLKSGGSIVINQTEALVAIDINTGKYVGKTARLEDTILKTNLDAIPEIVRQIRLRDLGGIIVIDFIDMDERRNRQKVTQALEDALQADRAPSKVLQFNDFGLVAITRKRVKQSLERTLSVPCPVCTGTGMVKSPATVANEIYTEMRKMLRHFERNDVLLRVHPDVVKVLKANNAKWLNELEEMIGKTIMVKSDPALPPEQFDIQG